MEATNMKNMQKTVDSQKEIDPRKFARVLGKRPLMSASRYGVFSGPELLSESFGPPEMKSLKKQALLYWNFVRDDSAQFTLFAVVPPNPKRKSGDIEVRLAAQRGVTSFCTWTLDRLGAKGCGDETPLFVGAGRNFIVSRVC
jgi:hypothetical protein